MKVLMQRSIVLCASSLQLFCLGLKSTTPLQTKPYFLHLQGLQLLRDHADVSQLRLTEVANLEREGRGAWLTD